MWNWIKRATSPSGSRWGFFSFFIAISMFLLALSPSFYAIYLSFVGGVLMPATSWLPSLALILAIITGIAGVGVALLAFWVGIWWLRHPADSPFTQHSNLTKPQIDVGMINKKAKAELQHIKEKHQNDKPSK